MNLIMLDRCEKIMDEGVNAITDKIGDNLKSLQHLSINFGGYNSQYRLINLSRCSQITISAKKSLVSKIPFAQINL